MDTELLSIRSELEVLRAAHVKSLNERYDTIMDRIVSDAIAKLDVDAMKRDLKNKLRESPERTKISTMFKVDLDDLFVKTSFAKDVVTPEFWFKYKDKTIKCRLSRDSMMDHSQEAFTAYLYTTDPHLAKIRKLLYDAFPTARMSQFFFIHPGNIAPYITFEIIYEIRPMGALDGLRVVV